MDGQRVFVLSVGTTGALTPVAGSPLDLRIPNGGPSAFAADPSGQFLFDHAKHKIYRPERYGGVVPRQL